MKKIKKSLFGVVFLFVTLDIRPAAVTYELSDGRFGDNLCAFVHAKWISYKYNIPLLLKPFNYSHLLKLSQNYAQNTASKTFNRVIRYTKQRKHTLAMLNIQSTSNNLYVIPFFPESRMEAKKRFYFEVDWNDKRFVEEVRKDIQLISPLPTLQLPTDRITVAVHVRSGSGHDTFYPITRANDVRKDPLRFPPDSYYIEQINYLAKFFTGKELYVHIFTDYNKPLALVEKYKRALNNHHITFGCSHESLTHPLGLLKDFFDLTLFDCLIRSESHFSIMAGRLANYRLIINPIAYKGPFGNYTITQVNKVVRFRT